MVGGWIKAEGGCEGGGNCLKYLKRGWKRKERKGSKDFKKGGKLDQGVGALKRGGVLEPHYEPCLIFNFFRNFIKISQFLRHFALGFVITNKEEGIPHCPQNLSKEKKIIYQSNFQTCMHKALLC